MKLFVQMYLNCRIFILLYENSKCMKMHIFDMEITDENNGFYTLLVHSNGLSTTVEFSPESKTLRFLKENKLSEFLIKNEYQFRKVLHIKKKKTWYKGFILKFVLRDEKDVAAFNDINKIVVVDKRNGKSESYVIDSGKENLTELYIDGSYMEKTGKGGYAVIIKSPEGLYDLKTFVTGIKSSSLIELLAAIKGLELLPDEKEIRIVTDSQYVRKGLTEWILNWKLNDWTTASGEKVKNIEYWKKFDELTKGRYIEFKYVKAHSQQFENTMADLYAKDMAREPKKL